MSDDIFKAKEIDVGNPLEFERELRIAVKRSPESVQSFREKIKEAGRKRLEVDQQLYGSDSSLETVDVRKRGLMEITASLVEKESQPLVRRYCPCCGSPVQSKAKPQSGGSSSSSLRDSDPVSDVVETVTSVAEPVSDVSESISNAFSESSYDQF